MTIDTRSTNEGLPVPVAANNVSDDIPRLAELVTMLDTIIFGLRQDIANRSTTSDLLLRQAISAKNAANGYAGIDAQGFIPIELLPPSIQSSLKFQNVYNATTNTPALPTPAPANAGFFWIVSVAGGAYSVGDWAVSNGTAIVRVPTFSPVSSVNTKTGAVSLVSADISDSNRQRFVIEKTAGAADSVLTFTGLGSFSSLYFDFENILATAGSVFMKMQFSSDGVTFGPVNGCQYSSDYVVLTSSAAPARTTGGQTLDDFIRIAPRPPTGAGIIRTSDVGGAPLSGQIVVKNFSDTKLKMVTGRIAGSDNPTFPTPQGHCSVTLHGYVGGPAFTAVRFAMSAGNFGPGGKIRLHAI